MIAKFKQGSRNYAKRQITWFKAESRIVWFDTTDGEFSKVEERILMHMDKQLA